MEPSTVSMQQPFPWALIAGSVLLVMLFLLAETELGRRFVRSTPALSNLLAFLRVCDSPQVKNDTKNPNQGRQQDEPGGPVERIEPPFTEATEYLHGGPERQGSSQPPPERVTRSPIAPNGYGQE